MVIAIFSSKTKKNSLCTAANRCKMPETEKVRTIDREVALHLKSLHSQPGITLVKKEKLLESSGVTALLLLFPN